MMPSCYWSVSLPLYQVEEHRRLTWVRRLEDGGRRGVSVPSSATVADPASVPSGAMGQINRNSIGS